MTPAEKLLEHFRRGRPGDSAGIDLTLRPAYLELLRRLGDPQKHLPPVFHVAGTNGKGSTCAYLRAILEANGHAVHVYTSPHLVKLNERFRVAGHLITDDALESLLEECKAEAPEDGITMFEAMTAVALVAFARTPASFTILETGLGGRLDATNVVERPQATLITRLSYDHREFLGESLTEIAHEKAGIMKKGVPCYVGRQHGTEGLRELQREGARVGSKIFAADQDWQNRIKPERNGFRFESVWGNFDFPPPNLLGDHQFDNASLAIATLMGERHQDTVAIGNGLKAAEWSARLEKLTSGRLQALVGDAWELWLDGGHNDSAGDALATEARHWRHKDDQKNLHLIFGMIKTKRPSEFLNALTSEVASIHTIAIPSEPQSFLADDLKQACLAAGARSVESAENVSSALRSIVASNAPGRILICGSLYLAGKVLAENNP